MSKLTFIACSNIIPELKYILEQESISDVEIVSSGNNCNMRYKAKDIDRILANHGISDYMDAFIIGSVCMDKETISELPNLKTHIMENCFELFMNKPVLIHYISKRYFIISPGWLQQCWDLFKQWGFNKSDIKDFFKESADKMLFLNTGVMVNYIQELDKVSEYIGIGYEILEVGIDYLKNYIIKVIAQWRSEKENIYFRDQLAMLTQQSANYALIFDQIEMIASLSVEEEIVSSVMDIMNILFAPTDILYLPYFDGNPGELISFKGCTDDYIGQIEAVSKSDFLMPVVYLNQQIATFKFIGVTFPQYIERYKELTKVLNNVCSLGIANSRKYLSLMDKEKEIREVNAELVQTLNQKDKLLSVIAHDMRGPISNLISLSSIISDALDERDCHTCIDMVQHLSSESERANHLIKDLLEWGASQSGRIAYNPSYCNFSKIEKEVLRYVNEALEQKGISFQEEIASDCKVYADCRMIVVVLRNLISNSVKFTPSGGEIELKMETVDDNFIRLSVIDNGIGMPEAIRTRLFQVGENVSRSGTNGENSTGLGLLISNDFIKKHESSIDVKSEEGKGTEMSFKLKYKR